MNDRDCENCKHHTDKGCESWACNYERRMTVEEALQRLVDQVDALEKTMQAIEERMKNED